jgi:hypothetical protein
MRLVRSFCTASPGHSPLPPTPLNRFLRAGVTSLRTAYTHHYELPKGVDRSTAAAFRLGCREGLFTQQTSGCAPGFVQANFVALPCEYAFDFLKFCLNNPRACPLLEVTNPGDPHPRGVAAHADLRTDIPKYRVWRDGELAEEVDDVTALWDEGMVGFLLGCSFSWEMRLQVSSRKLKARKRATISSKALSLCTLPTQLRLASSSGTLPTLRVQLTAAACAKPAGPLRIQLPAANHQQHQLPKASDPHLPAVG